MDFFKKASESFGSKGGESDLLKQAEGFLSSQTSGSKTEAPAEPAVEKPAAAKLAAEKTAAEKPAQPGTAPAAAASSDKADYSNVYGSAQTLYQGLQDKLSGKKSDIDNQDLAGAAADVLKAAESSGFAKDSKYNEYFDKAETYLDDYAKPKSSAPATATPPAAAAPPAAATPAAATPAAAQPAATKPAAAKPAAAKPAAAKPAATKPAA